MSTRTTPTSETPSSKNQKEHRSSTSKRTGTIRMASKRAIMPVSYRLTREGWQVCFMIGFVVLGAILRDVNLLVLIAGTLIGLLLVQWRVAIKTIQRLTAHRQFPRTMQAKRPFEIELTIENPKTWLGAWWVDAEEQIRYESNDEIDNRSPLLFQSLHLLFPSVPPNSTRSLRYQCRVDKRGKYSFQPTLLTSRFPLGLLRSILRTSTADSILVHPATGTLMPGWQELFRGKRTGTHESSSRTMSDQGEFFGLRSYHPGDSPRWIHWRSTARKNELMVKQYQQSSSQELILLLDLHRSDLNEQIADPAVSAKLAILSRQIEEWCVEFAATVVTYVSNSSSTILTLAIADRQPTVASKLQTRGQAMAVLDRLATSLPSSSSPASNQDIHNSPAIPGSARLGETLASTLELLEREFRRVDNLVVVSTRSRTAAMGNDLFTPDGKRILPFWNQVTWIDASNSELTPYFKPMAVDSSALAKD